MSGPRLSTPKRRKAGTHMGKVLILIIEDSPVVQSLLKEILSSEYDLDMQGDGIAGLAAAQASKPDLILLDIHMPRMDGYEVCRVLKTSEATRDIPIIFITSLDSEKEKVRGFEAGADDYVVKPFYKEELQARVKAHLSFHKAKIQALTLERLTVFKEMAVALSHEINNPLTTIFAYVHHLQKELAEAPPSVTSAIDGIKGELTRIQRITSRLAVASKAQKVSYNKDVTMIDLHDL
jgi:DNA-binding response OmpR family regulator